MLNAPIVFPHPQYGSSISGQNNLPFQLSSVMRKPFFWASDQVRHNQGCTATEAGLKVPFRKERECTYYAAKPKAMISCGITGQLICAFIFVYTYTKSRFSHKMAHLEVVRILITMCNIIFEDWKFRQKSYFVELSTMSMDKIKSVMLRRTCWLDCIFI